MEFFKRLDTVRRLYLFILIAGIIAGLDGFLQFSGIGSPEILKFLANLAWLIMLILGFFALILQRRRKLK